ncbi:MAG: EAL domain-containing protein [Burkholderiales bacterium]|nr:EAL domain-containing protein [Burkholderiales bacterium]
METYDRLFSRQVELLYRQAKGAAGASLAAAAFLAITVSSKVPGAVLALWLVLSLVSSSARLVLWYWRRSSPVHQEQAVRWSRAFMASVAFSGLVWSGSLMLFAPYLSIEYQVILGLVICGVCAACLPVFAAVPQIYRMFAICAMGPVLAWTLVAGLELTWEFAAIGAVFLSLMLHTSARLSSMVVAALRTQFANDELVESLKKEIDMRQATEEAAQQSTAVARHLAHHDSLTGLPNRSHLIESLKQALSLARRQQFSLGLLMFDLDRFKAVNDTMGHAAGDALICQVAERLKQNLRTEDLMCRPGSDEFLIVLPYINDSQDLARAAHKLQRCLEAPFQLEDTELFVTLSIGIAAYPHDGDSPEQLILRAETAMYQAKKGGGNGFAFYAAEMSALAREHLHVENQLRYALERKEFELHYQPQKDLQNGKIIGVEALIRWNLPGQGMIAPLKFIPIAEVSGLIVPIGEWVLTEACRQAQEWQARGADPIRVAVNVSARQFKDANLIKKIAQSLETSGLDPRLLELELTESIVMEDPVSSARRLNEIRDLGVSISIDDFGTGYSSLSYLKQFPIDVLKIDRSFVRDVNVDQHNAAIVTAILAMARQLQIEVVAEGIETAEQEQFLAEHGCQIGQGYHFSKPLPAADCEKLFDKHLAKNVTFAFSVVK